jgi:hypothetical protein
MQIRVLAAQCDLMMYSMFHVTGFNDKIDAYTDMQKTLKLISVNNVIEPCSATPRSPLLGGREASQSNQD